MSSYTGIGSRETPKDILSMFHHIGETLARDHYILRSGGASGADSSFESGCLLGRGKSEIYLPWKWFNKSPSTLYKIPEAAFQLAKSIHPNWAQLKLTVRRLHARNCLQILGLTLDEPSRFVVCWTPRGAPVGGTRTAIVLAEKNGIPVYNFGGGDLSSLMMKIAGHLRNSTLRLEWTIRT